MVNNGNVAYVSALTLAEMPEQYIDLKTFLGYGERGNDAVALTQSVYGHVLLTPETFGTYNDAVLKASLLRAARRSDLMYAVDAGYSARMTEIVLAELAGWSAGTGGALPEMLVALATERLRLQDADRSAVRAKALAAGLPEFLIALAAAIPA